MFAKISAIFLNFPPNVTILRVVLKITTLKEKNMAKISLCTIRYTYEHYASIDVQELSNNIYKYAKKEFEEFYPKISKPGNDLDMPDYVDTVLCKKNGGIFLEHDILRRAINIPQDCQEDGLVLEISILNCDDTRYWKRHKYQTPWWKRKDRADSKPGVMQLKIHKTFGKKGCIYWQAHDCSINNKEQLKKSEKCGCFFCGRIFPPSEITTYISPKEPTAECPYCYTDSVIGDASGFTITPKFLRVMKKRWF